MRKIFLSIVLLAVGATSFAQQSLWSGTQVESPVVNPDGTVTFNIFAPKAVKVEVTGDFLPPVKIQTPNGEMEQQGVAELTEKNGVWTFTSQKLDPELYAYNVIVNGMSMLDPSNAYVSRYLCT